MATYSVVRTYHRMYYWTAQHMLNALSFAAELTILTRLLISETVEHPPIKCIPQVVS